MADSEPNSLDEVLEKEEKRQKINMSGLATAVATMTYALQFNSAEQSRKRLKEKWKKEIYEEIVRNPDLFHTSVKKEKGESRRQFLARQRTVAAQNAAILKQIDQVVTNVMDKHSVNVYKPGSESGNPEEIIKTVAESIQEEHPEIQKHQEAIAEGIVAKQAEIAETYVVQNEQINQKFVNKGPFSKFSKSTNKLAEVEKAEQAAYLSESVTKKALKEELAAPSSPEQTASNKTTKTEAKKLAKKEAQIKLQNSVYKNVLYKVFNSVDPKNLSEAEFARLVNIEVNKMLNNRRDRRRFRSFNRDQREITRQINRLTHYWSAYFKKPTQTSQEDRANLATETVPIQANPSLQTSTETIQTEDIKQKQTETISASKPTLTATSKPNNIQASDRSNSKTAFKFDFTQLKNQFNQFLSRFYQSMGNGLSSLNNGLSQVPTIGNFFGGGSQSGFSNIAQSLAKSGLRKLGKSALSSAAKTAGSAVAKSAITTAAPVLAVIGIVFAIIIGIFIFIQTSKDVNTVTKPQAIIESQQQTN